jgi:hypothetical protein
MKFFIERPAWQKAAIEAFAKANNSRVVIHDPDLV